MPNDRFRQPEQVKEQQARALKRRFAAYLGDPPRRRVAKARRLLRLLATAFIAVVIYAIWRTRDGG